LLDFQDFLVTTWLHALGIDYRDTSMMGGELLAAWQPPMHILLSSLSESAPHCQIWDGSVQAQGFSSDSSGFT